MASEHVGARGGALHGPGTPRRRLVPLGLVAALVVSVWAPTAAGAQVPDPWSITVTPDTDLVDGQIVVVEGSGFEPNWIFEIFQCAGDSVDEMRCDPRNAFDVDSDDAGNIPPYSFAVDARIYLGPEGTEAYDCRTEPAGCRIGVGYMLAHSVTAFADLGFDPDAPLLPPVTATVAPTTGLADGDVVHVEGANLTTREETWVLQCRTGSPGLVACDWDAAVRLVADPDGTVAVDVPVRSAFDPPAADPVDCTAAPGTCSIAVSWGLAAVPDRTAEVPLTFAQVPTSSSTTSTTSSTTSSTTTSAVVAAPSSGSVAAAAGQATLPATGGSADLTGVAVVLLAVGAASLAGAARVRRAAERPAADGRAR